MMILTSTLLVLIAAGPSTTVFPFCQIGQGPRAAALGEAFSGLSDDATAVYWNPAGLGQDRRLRLALSHQQWFAGINDELAHAAIPIGPTTLGLGLAYSREPDVLYWNDALQRFDNLNVWSGMLTAGLGMPLSDQYRLGVSLTGIYQDLRLEHGVGGYLDIGAFGRPLHDLGVGLVLRRLGTLVRDNDAERLPTELAAGAGYRLGIFRGTLDAALPLFGSNPVVRAGIECTPVRPLSLRVGYRTGPVNLNDLGFVNGLSGGIGINIGNLAVDYALVPYGILGLTHRIGLSVMLPR